MPSRPSIVGPLAARALLVASLLGAACNGSVGSSPDRNGNSDPGTGSTGGNGQTNPGAMNQPPLPPGALPPPGTGACAKFDPGESPLRLMTRVEYDNTVRDLLGDTRGLALAELPEDTRPVRGFNNDTPSRAASDQLVGKYLVVAEKLATDAVGQKLSTLLGGCDPVKDGESACLTRFLDGFARRAWRRPLTADEKSNLTRAFNDGKTRGFAAGLQSVLEVMLISPQFLYRYELGTPVTGSPFAKLTGWEVASRLSYLMWGSMPDPELFKAAEEGKLSTPAEVETQARRMMADPRYLPMATNFAQQVLHVDELPSLDKDTGTLPKWSEDLREPMAIEAARFIQSVFGKDGDGKLETFLTAPYTFVNAKLAAHYGIPGPAGAEFQKVNMPADKHAGVLTQSGFLSVHATPDDGLTSLVFRGEFVREDLLCQPVPDPPPNALDENPPFTDTTTSREWSYLRSAKPVCGACHVLMDPIGFAFENFDPIGKYRTLDRGKPVDATGELTGTDVDGKFNGIIELSKKLGSSKTVRDCVATQWFRFAAGRQEDEKSQRDQCSLDTLRAAFDRSGGDVRELLVAYTQTNAFLFRSKGDPQ
jgi:hypothetical protein